MEIERQLTSFGTYFSRQEENIIDLQRRISDMEIDGPNLGQCLSQKVGFFLLFEPILRAGFLYCVRSISNLPGNRIIT